MCNNGLQKFNFRVHTNFKEVDMEHLRNNGLIIDKHIKKQFRISVLIGFKNNGTNDLISNERSKLRTYRLFKMNLAKTII